MLREKRSAFYAMTDSQLADAHLKMLLEENGIRILNRADETIFEGSYSTAFHPAMLRQLYGWFESRRIVRLIRFAAQNVTHRITQVGNIDFTKHGLRIEAPKKAVNMA